MRIDVISAVPDSLVSPLNTSILKRAQERNLAEIVVHNLRDYAYDKHKQIDDKPFGGGPGMLLKPEPFFECIEKLVSERKYDFVLFPSPGGELYNQKMANRFSLAKNILILAGHYKGVDDRVREKFATNEISIGNYVLTGGEIAAWVIIDSVVRLIPGVLNDSESALNDSLMDGDIIEAPYYTRPAEYKGMNVPEVLLSGHDKKIKDWKEEQSKVLTDKWKKINNLE
ncbi:MAG: tRNA (guanosine(37)-N1)-methyltransferase TrmD [Stygiobacter sp. RIFOXYC12_FULL_38_8]|nr:MAG: tRNA (guanosine(37)-N1)-methyltransferase TrmD [Stygiobacter sp. GWC2_38_9]OGV09071.1 MAG: tRNA (guanosine(37)-N1)-methyltransferase TrmD [Stygiobacter sp. RIFOXYB2_FULL_37_11]OGV14116.1 MAG: tRNA (guanosine(37)-N1)-methyltransferase TrmD [Stygiobacter sp. RIFOXYA2_FULL_38_8]OGV16297.1 MAG: tRNA (guanosine(37)-N1)-methyltransferase TrmD [Stygiobacter sp. RIFOXYC2_FULL_38_25]OGV26731.1 MAG: tRNA (guanosine(37)-N1)-methyltransferase TrmD [Stygiobacter sp. RIFOXYC12_FULL_38_8]OGV81735.1 M